jgi:hypothetical protein
MTDAEGVELANGAAVEWQVDDPRVAQLQGYTGTQYVEGAKLDFSSVWLQTLARGDTTVHARSNGLEGVLSVHVP